MGFFSSVISWAIILAFFWWGLKSKFGKKYSDDELLLPIPKSSPEKFPVWFGYVYAIIMFLFFAFFIFALFYFPNIVVALQKLLYVKSDAILFLNSNTILVSMLPSLFLGMVVYAFVIKYLLNFFPKLNRYQAIRDRINFNTQGLSKEKKQEIWQSALEKVDLDKLALSEWRQIFIMGFFVWLIAGPVYILAMDNYVMIKKDSIAVNPFLGFSEQQYPFQDLVNAEVSAGAYKTKDGEYKMNPKFELQFKDGKKQDIWGGIGWGSPSSESLIEVSKILNSEGVKLEADPLDSEDEINAVKEYNQESQTTVQSVFTYLKSINTK